MRTVAITIGTILLSACNVQDSLTKTSESESLSFTLSGAYEMNTTGGDISNFILVISDDGRGLGLDSSGLIVGDSLGTFDHTDGSVTGSPVACDFDANVCGTVSFAGSPVDSNTISGTVTFIEGSTDQGDLTRVSAIEDLTITLSDLEGTYYDQLAPNDTLTITSNGSITCQIGGFDCTGSVTILEDNFQRSNLLIDGSNYEVFSYVDQDGDIVSAGVTETSNGYSGVYGSWVKQPN